MSNRPRREGLPWHTPSRKAARSVSDLLSAASKRNSSRLGFGSFMPVASDNDSLLQCAVSGSKRSTSELGLKFGIEPGTGISPVPPHGRLRDAEHFGNLRVFQPAEIAQFDYFCFL